MLYGRELEQEAKNENSASQASECICITQEILLNVGSDSVAL